MNAIPFDESKNEVSMVSTFHQRLSKNIAMNNCPPSHDSRT